MPLNLKDKLANSFQKLKDSTTLDERAASLLKPINVQAYKSNLNQFYRPVTGTLATQGRQAYQRFASQPIPKPLQPVNQELNRFLTTKAPVASAMRGIGRGTLQGGTFGFVRPPQVANPTGVERAGEVAGNLVGSMASFGKIAKPLEMAGKTALAASGLEKAYLARLAVPALTREVGQSLAYLGGNKLGGEDVNFKSDLAFGLGMSAVGGVGGLKGFGKGMDQGRTTRMEWDPEDAAILDRLREALKNRKITDKELDGVDSWMTRLASGYMKNSEIEKLAGKWGQNRKGMLKDMAEIMFKRSKDAPLPRETGYLDNMMMGIKDAQPTLQDIDKTLEGLFPGKKVDVENTVKYGGEYPGFSKLIEFPKGGAVEYQITKDAVVVRGIGNGGKGSTGEPTRAVRALIDYAQENGKEFVAAGVSPNSSSVSYWDHFGLKQTSDPYTMKLSSQPTKGDTTLNDLQKSGLVSGFAGGGLPRRTTQTGQKVIDRTKLKGPQLSKTNKVLLEEAPKEEIESFQRQLDRGSDVKKKVGILDYIRTPQKVLDKIGLGEQGKALRESYDQYQLDLNDEIGKVNQWYEQASSPESAQRIFKWLDGQKVDIPENELKIAKEIKGYLADWADKLELPTDKRVSNYITHLFEDQLIQKEFDPELAKLIDEKVPGSVYNPFLQKRYGIEGYKENVWEALDAYVKRATRKVNMDPALEQLKKASSDLDLESGKYVQRLASRINLRPTETDNLLDNTIKQLVGYRFTARPTAKITRTVRNTIYRAALGLNVGSAVRNLTQGVNTYAKLGEKYTLSGYAQITRRLLSGDIDELKRVGVLDDSIIQDRHFSAFKGMQQRADNVLWAMFDLAEKINRGSAYYGAKAKALAKGMSEEEAIKFAKGIVRDTQFTFGSVDTPVALSSDLVKTLAQFQSYNIKQLEFLQEMVKNKELGGLARYIGATLVVTGTIGKIFGYDVKDALPFSDILTGEGRFSTPLGQITENVRGVLSTDEEKRKRALKDLPKSAALLVPGGTQIKKTIEGLGAVNKGYSETSTGRVRFPVEQSLGNTIKGGLLGQYNLPEAREYFDKERSILGESQSELFKQATNKRELYDKIMSSREMKNQEDEIREQVREGNQSQYAGTKLIYYNNTSDQVESIDIGKVATMPENSNLARALKEKEVWATTNKVMKADVTPEQKQQALQALGVKPEEATYYSIATYDSDIKMAYLKDVMPQIKDRNTLLKTLSMMRGEINGQRILSNDMIDELYNEGIIGANEKSMLKKLKYKDGKIVNTGKGKKISVPSLVTTSQLLSAFNNYLKARTAMPASSPSRTLSDLYNQRRKKLQNLTA